MYQGSADEKTWGVRALPFMRAFESGKPERRPPSWHSHSGLPDSLLSWTVSDVP